MSIRHKGQIISNTNTVEDIQINGVSIIDNSKVANIIQKGGWREVSTALERDAIPDDQLEVGMIVYVVTEAKAYLLTTLDTTVIPTLKTWEDYKPGQGDYIRKITTYPVSSVAPLYDGEIVQYQGPIVPPYFPGYFFKDTQEYSYISSKSSNMGPASVRIIDLSKLETFIRQNQSVIPGGWSDIKIVFSNSIVGNVHATNGETEYQFGARNTQEQWANIGLEIYQSANYPQAGSVAYIAPAHFWKQTNVQPSLEVINDVQHTDTDKALSANMGYELQEQITALSGRGRYLATWDMVTGLPTSLPTTPSPYEYKNGDYYVVARAQKAEPESFTVNQTSGTPYDYVNPVMSIYKAKRFTEAGIDPTDEDDIFNYSKIVTRSSEGNQGTEKVAVANQGKFDAIYAQRLAYGQEIYGERLISVSDDIRARWFEYGGVLYLQVMANYHYWSDDPEPQEQDSDEGYVSQNYAVSSAWTLDQKKQMVKDWFMAVAGLEITGDMYYGMAPWYEEIHFLEEDTEAVNAFWTLNGEKLPVGEALQDYGIYAGAREQEYGDSIVAHYRTLKVNYKPNGSQFVYDPAPVASTTVETELVNANDTYLYDGTNWILLSNTQKEIVFSMIAGSPYDNTELANALDAKQDNLPDQTGHDGQFLKTSGSQLFWADAPSYMEDLQYFGIKSNPTIWTYSTVSLDMTRPSKLTSGNIYTITNASIVKYDELDTTTEFGNDLPRNEGKKYTLFYGSDLITDLGVEKNYVWVDSDNVFVGDVLPEFEGTDAVWFHTQYGGGYLIRIEYTNDGGTTWSPVSFPLMERDYYGHGADYNVAANFYKNVRAFFIDVQYILPFGKTEESKYNYKTVTQSAGYSITNIPENYNGYLIKAPWTTLIGTYGVNADNYGVIVQDGSEYVNIDTSGNFVPLGKIVNGEFSVPQIIVPIDNLQIQVNDLYNVKADRTEIEVINSKLEAGIVANPSLIEYTVNNRTATITGGTYWNVGSIIPDNEWDDTISEILDEGFNMSVTVPEGSGKYFLYYNTEGEQETWGYQLLKLDDDLFYPGAEDEGKSLPVEHVTRYHEKEDPTTHEKVYTPNHEIYDGDRIFRMVTLQNGKRVSRAVGYVNAFENNTITEYKEIYGTIRNCNYVQTENVLEFQGEDREVILSSEYLSYWYGWTDPRTQLMRYYGGGGNGITQYGAIYWDGTRYVNQRSIVFIGSRVTVYPNVRCLMCNGMNKNDQAQMFDYTVPRTIVAYTTPEMAGEYSVILTSSGEILFSKNIRTDISTNTFYVDEVPVIGCRIATCTVHNMLFESWEVDTPFRFATLEQLDTKVTKSHEASIVYGTDEYGNQTTYSSVGFGKVDDVRLHGQSVVDNKIANLETVRQVTTLPVEPLIAGEIVQYIGNTNANYTNGYFYKQTSRNTTYSNVAFESMGDYTIDVTVTDEDFSAWINSQNQTPFPIERGQIGYRSGDPLSYSGEGLDKNNRFFITVKTATEFGEAGFTFDPVIGPSQGVKYTVENTTTWVWEQVDVQPNTAVWGSITGILSEQTDLQDALDAKQDTLTEGTGISIDENNVISATFSESYFRGKFSTWNTVPTDYRNYYPDYTGSTKPTRTDYMVVEDPSSYIKPGDPIKLYNEPKPTSVAYARFVFGVTDVTLAHDRVQDAGETGVTIGTVGNQIKVTYNTPLWKITPLDVPIIVDGVEKPVGQVAFSWSYGSGQTEVLVKELNFAGQGGYEGTWRFSYQSDDWDATGKNGWEPEYQIEDVLPIATDTDAGIMKLYTTTGNNTDGTMDQNSITTELGDLQDQIDDLKGLGRFLSVWNSSTGLPETNPSTSPYEYKSGDYYLVGTVSSSTNYRPDGLSYTTDVPSTVVETEEVHVNDVYIFDGAVWKLQANSQREYTFSGIAGDPYDNTNLGNALDAKQDVLTNASNAGEGIIIDDVTQEISTNNIVWRKW